MTTETSSSGSQVSTAVSSTEARPHPLVIILGSALYTGFAPVASGTAGSLAALILYWIIPGFSSWYFLLPAALLFFLAGIPTASRMQRFYGPDPSEVVLDEVVGMWIALVFVPPVWYLSVLSFLVFRFFDIVKPQPARYFDRIESGFGIMMDDVVAGLYANLVVQIAALLLFR